MRAVCPKCEGPVPPQNVRYCSAVCRNEDRRVWRQCECGAERIYRSDPAGRGRSPGRRVYCSDPCRDAHRRDVVAPPQSTPDPGVWVGERRPGDLACPSGVQRRPMEDLVGELRARLGQAFVAGLNVTRVPAGSMEAKARRIA